jgi:hypothetical protein
MALPQNQPLDRVYLSAYMADVSAASSAWVASPVRGYIKRIRGILHGAITGADSTITAEINGTAITGISITVANTSSAAGDSYSDEPTALSTSFVNPGDDIEIISNGNSSTTMPMSWTVEIEVV